MTGTVTDSSGAVVRGATIQLTNSATGEKSTRTSNDAGVFTFGDLRLGTYQIGVTAPGFRPYEKTGIVINVAASFGEEIGDVAALCVAMQGEKNGR